MTISLADFSSRFNIIFIDFVKKNYFKEIGIEQHSNSINLDSFGSLEEKLVLAFGSKGKKMIPIPENVENLERDSLFDLIELLADHVSEHRTSTVSLPIDAFSPLAPDRFTRYQRKTHTLSMNSYDKKKGQKRWQNVLNEYLAQLDPPCKLTNMRIEVLPTSEGLRDLLANCASTSENSKKKIKHAQELFLKHGSTIDDKHSALKDLMDVLEIMRLDIKKYIPREEKELFNIANNYAIRHYNNKQKTRYDESYLQWFFYAILAAIDLVTKLKLANND